MVRKESYEVRTKMGGSGKGEAYVYNIVSKEELAGLLEDYGS